MLTNHCGLYIVCCINVLLTYLFCCAAEPPSFINTLPSVTKIAEGQTAVLICQVFGAPKPIITWMKDEDDVILGGRFRKENNGNLHISVSNWPVAASTFLCAFLGLYVFRLSIRLCMLAYICASLIIYWLLIFFTDICLQCFDAVGWAAGRASGL